MRRDYAPYPTIIHFYGFQRLLRLCTLPNYDAPCYSKIAMRLYTVPNNYAPLVLLESNEILHATEILCTSKVKSPASVPTFAISKWQMDFKFYDSQNVLSV